MAVPRSALEAGRYQIPLRRFLFWAPKPRIEVQLVEARTKADVQKIESQSKADAQRQEAEARAAAERLAAQSQAEVQRLQTEAEIKRLQERERSAQAYAKHPALLRMLELETMKELSRNANARIYIGFDKHLAAGAVKETE